MSSNYSEISQNINKFFYITFLEKYVIFFTFKTYIKTIIVIMIIEKIKRTKKKIAI